MTLETKIIAVVQAIGADIKDLRTKQGDLSALTTTAKTSIVASLNELHALVQAGGGGGAGIDDTAGDGATTVTWSADKIFDTVEAAKTAVKNELTAGASDALDTLAELAAALNDDPNFAATIASEIANRVRYDAAQTLTAAQQAQACANIGVGNPEHDFVADYTTAKA